MIVKKNDICKSTYLGNVNSLTNEKLLPEATSRATDNAGTFCP
jgi:hypothetical protein